MSAGCDARSAHTRLKPSRRKQRSSGRSRHGGGEDVDERSCVPFLIRNNEAFEHFAPLSLLSFVDFLPAAAASLPNRTRLSDCSEV